MNGGEEGGGGGKSENNARPRTSGGRKEGGKKFSRKFLDLSSDVRRNERSGKNFIFTRFFGMHLSFECISFPFPNLINLSDFLS